MDYILVLAVVVSFVAVVLIAGRVHTQRTAGGARDDLLRAGADTQVSPYRASRRAEGDAAWTRIGGGGF